jgi:CBS domain-containing protein
MTRDVGVIHPDAPVATAAAMMKDLNVGAIPVCDGDRLVGMITDRDITIRSTAIWVDPATTTVGEAMTSEVLYCFEDQDVLDAARLMEEEQIRRLPILDRKKRLVGIVSLGDLAVHTQDQRLSGEILEEVSLPAEPEH